MSTSKKELQAFYKIQSDKYDGLITCGYPHENFKPHKFTDADDCLLHIQMVHDKQPSPAELMEMLEHILITVSREGDTTNGK